MRADDVDVKAQPVGVRWCRGSARPPGYEAAEVLDDMTMRDPRGVRDGDAVGHVTTRVDDSDALSRRCLNDWRLDCSVDLSSRKCEQYRSVSTVC